MGRPPGLPNNQVAQGALIFPYRLDKTHVPYYTCNTVMRQAPVGQCSDLPATAWLAGSENRTAGDSMMRPKPPFQFHVAPSSGVPVYRQLMDQVQAELSSGRLSPGDLLPSVREVARRLQINPMTASKAYSKLEAQGVVELVRGQGMRVRAPVAMGSVKERQAQLKPVLEQAVARAHQLALTESQVRAVLDPLLKGHDHE